METRSELDSMLLELFDETEATRDLSSDEDMTSDARERNRMSVQRYYYRQINTIQRLRDEVDRLENRCRQILQEKRTASIHPTADSEEQLTAAQRLHVAYVELVMLCEALGREKEELLRVLTDNITTEKRLRRIFLLQRRRTAAINAILEERQQHPAIKIRSVTADECQETTLSAYEHVMDFRQSTEAFTSGVTAFGWRDRYHYEKEHLQFSLKKTLLHHSFDDASVKMWNLVNNGEAFAQIYPAKLRTLFHPVQTLDSNNLIYFHTIQLDTRSDYRNKCLLQCSRVSVMNGDGCLMVFRSLDPCKYVLHEGEASEPTSRRGRKKISPDIEEMWVDTFLWCLFERTSDDDSQCTVEFGGVLIKTPIIPTSWWVVERLQTMLRFEQHVLGQSNRLLG
ncbi:hypothetical protein Poli38472_014243 [Pythium oligandrum]|uniref:Uncharacterized protein n=1 Tax=Pythium oligandrum TaxID=41045 RepID=A0A8K1FIR9_PYTOL|nr:hypothetical protein Poli38472_014243 [Pythium oligandrum]|eukprot:TMW64126.1 hypothetical protein Poli38472_014243 [Pythium oligandrum]